ncbi:MAG TPA: NAD(P)-binding domain-containing protein, partial [Chloroflexota bacterium]|nr:NAD(P)-binding domain-containing protein [Chloroflexota bacterium]
GQIEAARNIPLEGFVRYGKWVQSQVAPDVDRRRVTRVERAPGGFELTLEDGVTVGVERVVVAAGIAAFPNRPQVFDGLPSELVTHASENRDLGRFNGRRVIVVGAGQSALESAVLLREHGAEVEVLARAPGVNWIGRGGRLLRKLGPLRGPVSGIVYTTADVGPPGINWFVSAPNVFRRLPRGLQDRMARRAIRPAGAAWLMPRSAGLGIVGGRTVIAAGAGDDGVTLRLDDETERYADHVLLGTGYRVDIARYEFLPPKLLAQVRQVNGYPVLSAGFETSVPGLHIVGAPGAYSFGPLMRFVAGTSFAASNLARAIAGRQPDQRYAAVEAGT